MAPDVGDTWKENFLLAAEALGRTGEAEQALAEYEERADALGASLGDPAATTVSPLRFTGGGTVRAYRPESFLGPILADIGVSLPDLPAGEIDTFTELSPEQLQLADGDVVLYSSYGTPEESGEQAVTAGPLWPRLQAVASDRAHRVEDDYFYTGIGLGAAELVLDDLEGILTGTP